MDTTGQYLTDSLTNEAVSFISRYDKEKPFMLSFYYYTVHGPHHGRIDWLRYYKDKGLNGKEADYAAMVSAMDESVGRVMKALRDKGIEDRTMVLFLSDQGGTFNNDPLRGGKLGGETLCEGGSRVPFIAYYPGSIEKGAECREPVMSSDLFPTIVALAGGEPGNYRGLDGVKLQPLLFENKKLDERAIFSYRSYEDQYLSIREGRYKYIAYRSGKRELYDLSEDIGEENNLIEEKPELARKFEKMRIKWEKEKGVYDINKNYDSGK